REDAARLLRGEVELEDRVLVQARLLDVEDVLAVGVPAHGESAADVAGVVAQRVKERNRLRRLAVLLLRAEPAGVERRAGEEELAGRVVAAAEMRFPVLLI